MVNAEGCASTFNNWQLRFRLKIMYIISAYQRTVESNKLIYSCRKQCLCMHIHICRAWRIAYTLAALLSLLTTCVCVYNHSLDTSSDMHARTYVRQHRCPSINISYSEALCDNVFIIHACMSSVKLGTTLHRTHTHRRRRRRHRHPAVLDAFLHMCDVPSHVYGQTEFISKITSLSSAFAWDTHTHTSDSIPTLNASI